MTWREWWQAYALMFGVALSDEQGVADGWWPFP